MLLPRSHHLTPISRQKRQECTSTNNIFFFWISTYIQLGLSQGLLCMIIPWTNIVKNRSTNTSIYNIISGSTRHAHSEVWGTTKLASHCHWIAITQHWVSHITWESQLKASMMGVTTVTYMPKVVPNLFCIVSCSCRQCPGPSLSYCQSKKGGAT